MLNVNLIGEILGQQLQKSGCGGVVLELDLLEDGETLEQVAVSGRQRLAGQVRDQTACEGGNLRLRIIYELLRGTDRFLSCILESLDCFFKSSFGCRF